jgi:hypothetical protein
MEDFQIDQMYNPKISEICSDDHSTYLRYKRIYALTTISEHSIRDSTVSHALQLELYLVQHGETRC